MKAIIITAVVVVLILAVGIPVIHYATKSDESMIDAKTLATGSAVSNTPQETQAAAPAPQAAPEEDTSAKEVLEQYKQESTQTDAGPKVGYTIGYMLNQSRTQQGATCEPLLDAAQDKVADAEAAVKAKLSAYNAANEELNEARDADEDDSDEREAVEAAKKAYESALAAKYKAQDDLVKIRIQCAGYLTK